MENTRTAREGTAPALVIKTDPTPRRQSAQAVRAAIAAHHSATGRLQTEQLIALLRSTGRTELVHYAGAAHRDIVAWHMCLEYLADPAIGTTEAMLKSRALKAAWGWNVPVTRDERIALARATIEQAIALADATLTGDDESVDRDGFRTFTLQAGSFDLGELVNGRVAEALIAAGFEGVSFGSPTGNHERPQVGLYFHVPVGAP